MTKMERLTANKDEIIRRYLAGESMGSIAKTFDCNCGYIWTFLKKMNVELRVVATAKAKANEIIRMYQQDGLSAYEIAKRLGLSNNGVCYQLNKAGISIKHGKWEREEALSVHTDEIIQNYQMGFGAETIAKWYNCAATSVRQLLTRNGIKTRTLADYTYPVNSQYFDTITSPNQAWVCGWWFSDGCNMPQVPCIKLLITDKDVVDKIAKEMQYDGPINTVQPRMEHHKQQYALTIGSRQLSNALLELGCLRKKSRYGIFPPEECIPPHLHRHLLRGWFEGNGSIFKLRKDTFWRFSLVGTNHVCRSIAYIIRQNTGVRVRLVDINKKGLPMLDCRITSPNRVKAVLDWMYQDAELYLDRKYTKYQQLVQYCNSR